MFKYKPKMLYRVLAHGIEERVFYTLGDALLWIGIHVNGGRRFGCMLVTARQAFDAGFTIEQYREFV